MKENEEFQEPIKYLTIKNEECKKHPCKCM